MPAVGSLRICGYSNTDPRAVKPAMASRAAPAMVAAARRRVVWVVMAGSFRELLDVGLGGLVVGGAVPVPAQGRGQGVVERCGLVTEGGAELAVVHDPAVGELVQGVQELAQCRLGHAGQAQGGAPGGEDPGPVAGEP